LTIRTALAPYTTLCRSPGGRGRPRRWSPAVKLLVLCPHYAPDTAPTGEVMTSIGTELIARGHELHVVTSLPWYRHHRIEPGWERSEEHTSELQSRENLV